MYKRSLYITEHTAKKIDELAKKHNTLKADILRKAVDIGLNNFEYNERPKNPQYNRLAPNKDIAYDYADRPTKAPGASILASFENVLAHFFNIILR